MNLHEVSAEATKAIPATTTLALTFFGYSVEQWASVAALIFICLQAFFLLKEKWWDKRKDK